MRREIRLMQFAYYDALHERDKSTHFIGWMLLSVFIVFFIAALALLIW